MHHQIGAAREFDVTAQPRELVGLLLVQHAAEQARMLQRRAHLALVQDDVDDRLLHKLDLRHRLRHLVLEDHVLQRRDDGRLRDCRLDLVGEEIEPHLVVQRIAGEARHDHRGFRRARQAGAAHRLERLAQEHVDDAVRRHAWIDPDRHRQPLGVRRTAVIHHGVVGRDVVGHHHAAAVVEREERRAPRHMRDPAIDRLRHLVGIDRQPVAQRIGTVEIDREAGEQVLDRGLQRDAEHHCRGARRRDEAGEGEPLLPPQAERQTEQHERHRQHVLDEGRRLAVQPALEIAYPVIVADQPVGQQGDRDDDRDRKAAGGLVGRVGRQRAVECPDAPEARDREQHQDDDGPEDHFSVILILTPVSPCDRRSR